MRVTRRLMWAVALLALPIAVASAQVRIRVANNADWTLTLDATSLTGLAGTDFPANIESDPAFQSIRVQSSTGDWRIDVSRTNASWHPAIVVYLRRTSAGTGGTVSGGDVYQEITTTDTEFVTGNGNIRDVAIQFLTNGAFAGAGVPAGSYTTTVTYTITDNL